VKIELTENETKWLLEAYATMAKQIMMGGMPLPNVELIQPEPQPEPPPEGKVYPFPWQTALDNLPKGSEGLPFPLADCQGEQPNVPVSDLFADALQNIPAPSLEPEISAHLAEHFRNLGTLTSEEREEAHRAFRTFLAEWLVGWEEDDAPQANRVELMEGLGSGRATRGVLILAFERLALQTLVLDTLRDLGNYRAEDLNTVERLAGHLVQLANPCGFPELVGTMDYTKRWRRP
jgi:hypothetical protein